MLASPSLTLRFEATGREVKNFEQYTIDSAYMTSTDAFSVQLYEPDPALRRDLELQPIQLLIDGNLQVTGRIEITEIGSINGSTISCRGRDYIADLLECHVDPAIFVNTNMTLEQAVKLVAKPVGIETVSFNAAEWRNARVGQAVQTTVGDNPEFKTEPLKDFKPNPGEGIYEFLSRICVRAGCTLQPTMQRNSVLLDKPDYVQEPSYKVTRSYSNPSAASNNVLSASATRDYTKFPTVVMLTGKTGTSAERATTTTAYSGAASRGLIPNIVQNIAKLFRGPTQPVVPADFETDGTRVDNIQETIYALLPEGVTIFSQRIPPKATFSTQNALYRLFYMRDTLSKDTKQLLNTASRKAAERLKDCLQYTIVFRGHKDPLTGRTFASNTVIDVYDEICDVQEKLWVERCTYTYEPATGARTQLVCWRPGSFGIGVNQ